MASGTGITAVVFNYNYKRFLPDVLASLTCQDRPFDRIVVSDDDSPQDTQAELQAIVAAYPPTELIRNPLNLRNIAHYRARVAEITTGAYLLMSADDYLVDPSFVKDALALLDAHPNVVTVYGYHTPVDVQGHVVQARHPLRAPWTMMAAQTLRDELALQNNVPAVCAIVRTSIHQHVDAYPLPNRHCGDWQQWYLFTLYGDFIRMEREVCHYRMHDANMSVAVEREQQAGPLIAEGYAQLLARPEINSRDRARLELGRRRNQLRHASMRDLPAALLASAGRPGFGSLLTETLAERALRHAETLRRAARRRLLGGGISEMD